MKRPAFQFYPADWRNNAKLRRCSPAARGVWMDVLCLLHDADEYGVLRWPLKDIAQAAGASMVLVRELVAKDVLKGSEKSDAPYIYRPKHAGKLGEPAVLAKPDGGPVWYCSRFVRDEYVRQKRGESTRFDGSNQPPKGEPKGTPKGGFGEGSGDGFGDGSTSTSSATLSSVPDGTDGGQPPAPPAKPEKSPEDRAKADVWRAAVAVLAQGGCANEAMARSFMGKLVQDYTLPVVKDAVAAAVTAQPADAREYLKATCQRLKGERKDPVTVPSDDAAKTSAALAAEEAQFRAMQADPAAQARAQAARQALLATRAKLPAAAAASLVLAGDTGDVA